MKTTTALRAAAWPMLLCTLAVGCTSAPARERTAVSEEALSSSSVSVDGSTLATGTTVAVRVTGPGFDATLANGQGTLPALPTAGTFSVTTQAGDGVFGSFVVEAGQVVTTNGAVTFTPSGLGFDLTKLVAVSVPTGALTTPANVGAYRLVGVSDSFSGAPTFYLPPATYAVADPTGAHVYGAFTVAGSAVSGGTGAVVPTAAGVAFDTAALAQVVLPTSGLSSPVNLVDAKLGSDTSAFTGNLKVFLPDGHFTLTNPDGDRTFGSFDVAAHAVVAGGGAILSSGGVLAFDHTKLASVSVSAGTLSLGAPVQTLRLPKISRPFASSAVLTIPAGDYAVTDGGAAHGYGSFTAAGTKVVSSTGAVTVTATGIGFDNSALAAVTIPVFTQPAPTLGVLPGATQALAFMLPGNVLHLPDGHYDIANATGKYHWGSFDVAGHAVTAASGGVKLDPVRGLALQSCHLASVFMQWSTALPSFTIADVTSPLGSGFGPQIFSLPVGTYVINVNGPAATYPPGAYHFTVNPSGGVTNVTLPLPQCRPGLVPPSCIFFSGSTGTCSAAPAIAQCVGTPDSPAVVGAQCSAKVDNVSKLAGSCSDGGSGLASCTFDDTFDEVLSGGAHAVKVTATSSGGTSTSCTSYVVVQCSAVPRVACVGTSDAPASLPTAPATCGTTVDGTNGLAGRCIDAGSGVSCTFDGSASEVLAPGVHAIAVAGSSPDGVATCTSYVNVVDTESATIACDAPRTVECSGPTTTIADAAATCADNCGSCTTGCASGDLALGTQALSCQALDAAGNTSTCDDVVTVVDTTPPAATVSVSPTVLFPPDHKMHAVSLVTSATDVCDPAAQTSCSVSSNEAPLALGSGHTDPDIAWVGGQLFVRAERSGNGSGRVYTVACTSRDASGNEQTVTATVTVPHSAPKGH